MLTVFAPGRAISTYLTQSIAAIRTKKWGATNEDFINVGGGIGIAFWIGLRAGTFDE
jgi:hypothetical protein